MEKNTFQIGDRAVVMRKDRTGWGRIHGGKVVGKTDSHVQVFMPKGPDGAGDVNHDTAEWFAVESPVIKVVGLAA